MITLVTGASRSGKSEWAELLAKRSLKKVIYLATAVSNPEDPEWELRLKLHRDRRPTDWQTIEVAIGLPQQLDLATSQEYLLVDALGTWVANCLDQDQISWDQTTDRLLAAAIGCQSDLTIVAEEVGWGVVPAYPAGRLFRDRQGRLIRQLGMVAENVYLVTGGHAIALNKLGERLPPS